MATKTQAKTIIQMTLAIAGGVLATFAAAALLIVALFYLFRFI
jgi:hypothetical protein